MAGEIAAKLVPAMANVRAALVPPDARYGWDGTAPVLWGDLSLTVFRAGLIVLVEQVLSTGERTGLYVGDMPTECDHGKWGVMVYQGTAILPGDTPLAVLTVDWIGRQVVYPDDFDEIDLGGMEDRILAAMPGGGTGVLQIETHGTVVLSEDSR